MLGELAGEGRRAGRAGELGCGARTCWAEREAGKELAQVWAARGGKERKKGWAGVEGNGPGCGPWGKGKVGQRFGLPTGFGLVSLFFFWVFLSFPISSTTHSI